MKPIAIVGRYIPNSPTNVIDASITAGRGVGWFGLVEGRRESGPKTTRWAD